MAYLLNKKVKIYYEIFGDSGPFLVFINGFTRSSKDFRPMARHFQTRGYRTLIFDNRPVGKTISEDPFTLEDIADDLKCIIDTHQIEKASFVGFSMGGIIARCFAYKFPQKVKDLVLVSTPFAKSFVGRPSISFKNKSSEEIEESFSNFVAPNFFKKNKWLIQSMAKGVISEMKSSYIKSYDFQVNAIQKTPELFYKIKKEVTSLLVIHGDEDQIILPSSAEAFKKEYETMKTVIFSGAGHLLLIEKTNELYETLFNFLSKKT